MRLPDILGAVFFAPMIIFPIALSIGMHGTLKDIQKIMAVLLILWLALLWFGKGVFIRVIPGLDYSMLTPAQLKSLEINLDGLDPLVMLGLLMISRWLYQIIF